MNSNRTDELVAKLQKGILKTQAALADLTAEHWCRCVYAEPYPWTVRDLLAHFLSSEEALLRLVQDVVSGGAGAEEGFDYDEFNRQEQERLASQSPEELMAALQVARRATIDWVASLSDEDLDRCGRHPALGLLPVAMMIEAIYGHQLLHMRDVLRLA